MEHLVTACVSAATLYLTYKNRQLSKSHHVEQLQAINGGLAPIVDAAILQHAMTPHE